MFKKIQNFNKNHHAAPLFDLIFIISVEIKELQLNTVSKILLITVYNFMITYRYQLKITIEKVRLILIFPFRL